MEIIVEKKAIADVIEITAGSNGNCSAICGNKCPIGI